MSFIDEKIREHNEYLNRYKVGQMENKIANLIIEDAKAMIGYAIRLGRTSVSFVYNWDSDGYFEIDFYDYPVEQYMNSKYGGVISLAQCFKDSYGKLHRKGENDTALISAIRREEKSINLSNIENTVYTAVMGLGVKNAEVHVKYVDSHVKRTSKKKFFREYYEEETIRVERYKVYCRMSW